MQYFHEKSAQKKYRSQWQSAWRHMQKKHYVSAISDVISFVAERQLHQSLIFIHFPFT